MRPSLGESKHKEVRYIDIHEEDQLDAKPMPSWIRQGSELPGRGAVAPAGILGTQLTHRVKCSEASSDARRNDVAGPPIHL